MALDCACGEAFQPQNAGEEDGGQHIIIHFSFVTFKYGDTFRLVFFENKTL